MSFVVAKDVYLGGVRDFFGAVRKGWPVTRLDSKPIGIGVMIDAASGDTFDTVLTVAGESVLGMDSRKVGAVKEAR